MQLSVKKKNCYVAFTLFSCVYASEVIVFLSTKLSSFFFFKWLCIEKKVYSIHIFSTRYRHKKCSFVVGSKSSTLSSPDVIRLIHFMNAFLEVWFMKTNARQNLDRWSLVKVCAFRL